MKKWIALQLILVGALLPLKALGEVENFQNLIVESMEAKKDLGQKLKKNVDVVGEANLQPVEKVVIQDPVTAGENVASPTTQVVSTSKHDKSARRLEKVQMKRLSEELSAHEE